MAPTWREFVCPGRGLDVFPAINLGPHVSPGSPVSAERPRVSGVSEERMPLHGLTVV